MKKKIISNIIKISILSILFILIMIFFKNYSFALSDVTNWNDWEPKYISAGSKFSNKTSIIITIIQKLGILISVGTLSFIGIKFMLGSLEEKANYKQNLVPWLLGAVMVFAITTIPSILLDLAETNDNEIYRKNSSYVQGMDDMAIEIIKASQKGTKDSEIYRTINWALIPGTHVEYAYDKGRRDVHMEIQESSFYYHNSLNPDNNAFKNPVDFAQGILLVKDHTEDYVHFIDSYKSMKARDAKHYGIYIRTMAEKYGETWRDQ